MSRGFHAFFRQYYNLRALLRRTDPALERLLPLTDYPLVLAGGHARLLRRGAAYAAAEPGRLRRPEPDVHACAIWRASTSAAALELLDVDFPSTLRAYDGESAAEFLDRLRFPPGGPASRAGGVRAQLLR